MRGDHHTFSCLLFEVSQASDIQDEDITPLFYQNVWAHYMLNCKIIDFLWDSREKPGQPHQKFRLITNSVGTTLLHSPGWNEGKARNETLGIDIQKAKWAPMRSGTTTRAFDLRLGSAAPKGLLYDEILIKYLIETARQSLKTRKLRHSTNLSLQKNQTLNQSQKNRHNTL